MQLSRLRVKNIRSYEGADIDFGSGTTLVAGDVGAGKTSLLYAIEMALFGVAEVNAAYLVRHGAGHAEVSVTFEEPGKRYEISRRFRRLRRKGQETFEAERIRFTVDGAETAYSATELRQRVIDLLGFPDNPSPQAHSDLWRWAVYVPQERMRDILGARPQDRLETVRKALGVERYRTAAENAQDLASDLRRSAGTRRAEADRLRHFDEEFSEASQLGERLRLDRAALEDSLVAHRASLAALRVAREELEARARRAEADEREREGLERQQELDRRARDEGLRVLNERRAESARRVEDCRIADAEAKLLDDRRSAVAAAEGQLAALRDQLDQLSAKLRGLAETRATLAAAEQREGEVRVAAERDREAATEAKRTLDEALAEGPSHEPPAPTPDGLAAIDDRLSAARARESHSLQELVRAESSLAELDALLEGGVCPTCHQAVRSSDFAAHRTEASASVEEARRRREGAEAERARLEKVRASRERYERALERWTEVEKRRSAARAALARANNAAELRAHELEASATVVRDVRRRLEELLPEESRESELRAEMGRWERETSERSREVERSLLAAERRNGLEGALKALDAELARVERELATLHDRSEERGRRIEALRAARGEGASLREALAEAERNLAAAIDELAGEQSAVAALDAQLDDAHRRVRAAEAGRRERAGLLAEATDLEEKAAWVGTPFRATLLGMEQKLLTHAQSMFEREFARYFASLVDDPGLVARTDPAFTPLVMIEGEWTPAEALSGGERTSLALAFRLALAHVVRSMGSLRLDTILLDEPTDGFSPEQVVRMGELLEELALPQVILVSHESQLAAIADRVVRIQKVDGKSSVDPGTTPGAVTAAPSVPGALGPT